MTDYAHAAADAAPDADPAVSPLPAQLVPVVSCLLAALAHPGRRAIFELLGRQGELSAGEVAQAFPRVTRQAVSAHLQVLREAGLVGVRQRRRYRVDRRDTPERQALAALDASSTPRTALYYSQNAGPLSLLWLWAEQAVPAQQSTAGAPSRS